MALPRRIMSLFSGRRGGADAPVVTGIVDWMGPSANSGIPGTDWIGSLTLLVWREGDGPAITERLWIEQTLGKGDQATKAWMSQFSAGETVRLALAGPVDRTAIGFRARLASKMPTAEDEELRAIAAPLLNPPPYDDPVLGRFVPHARMPALYEQVAEWLGQPLNLTLSTQTPADLPDCAATAVALISDTARWQAAAEAMIVESLYDLWLEEWREEEDPVLDHADFLARLTRPALTVYADGSFEFEWEDDSLFLGHCVMATGTLEEGFDDAGIAG